VREPLFICYHRQSMKIDVILQILSAVYLFTYNICPFLSSIFTALELSILPTQQCMYDLYYCVIPDYCRRIGVFTAVRLSSRVRPQRTSLSTVPLELFRIRSGWSVQRWRWLPVVAWQWTGSDRGTESTVPGSRGSVVPQVCDSLGDCDIYLFLCIVFRWPACSYISLLEPRCCPD